MTLINPEPDNLFKGKYRIESTRLKSWNYANSGYYSVTICVKNRECLLGCIENDSVILSDIGEIAKKSWIDIPHHYPFVVLDEYVIMPNHIHGIVIIDKNEKTIVETLHATSLRDIPNSALFSRISPKYGSLSSVIRSFKSAVTKLVNNKFPEHFFLWQTRFYDSIIRNDKELLNIRNYIINNPLQWNLDEENPDLYIQPC